MNEVEKRGLSTGEQA